MTSKIFVTTVTSIASEEQARQQSNDFRNSGVGSAKYLLGKKQKKGDIQLYLSAKAPRFWQRDRVKYGKEAYQKIFERERNMAGSIFKEPTRAQTVKVAEKGSYSAPIDEELDKLIAKIKVLADQGAVLSGHRATMPQRRVEQVGGAAEGPASINHDARAMHAITCVETALARCSDRDQVRYVATNLKLYMGIIHMAESDGHVYDPSVATRLKKVMAKIADMLGVSPLHDPSEANIGPDDRGNAPVQIYARRETPEPVATAPDAFTDGMTAMTAILQDLGEAPDDAPGPTLADKVVMEATAPQVEPDAADRKESQLSGESERASIGLADRDRADQALADLMQELETQAIDEEADVSSTAKSKKVALPLELPMDSPKRAVGETYDENYHAVRHLLSQIRGTPRLAADDLLGQRRYRFVDMQKIPAIAEADESIDPNEANVSSKSLGDSPRERSNVSQQTLTALPQFERLTDAGLVKNIRTVGEASAAATSSPVNGSIPLPPESAKDDLDAFLTALEQKNQAPDVK